jgi:hypothetical protein
MEQWKNINKHYAISNKGNVKSLRYDRLLKPHIESGRKRTAIRHFGEVKKVYIDNLMQEFWNETNF